MAQLLRSRVQWSGSGIVGPGVTTFYNDTSATPAAITPALNTLFNAFKSYVPAGVTWTIENGGDTIDSTTGELTGAWVSGGAYTLAGTAFSAYAAGVGGRVDWKSSDIVNKRRLRGAFYICPIASTNYETDGSLANGMVSAVNTAVAAYLGTAGLAPRLWHRPNKKKGTPGTQGGIVSGSMPDKVSWLRSRRV